MALLAMAAVAAPVPAADEIVVIARKMRFIKVDIKAPRRNGALVLERCRITRGSGNAELDAVPCDVAQSCIADVPATRSILLQCVTTRSQPRIDAVAARWRAASGPVQ